MRKDTERIAMVAMHLSPKPVDDSNEGWDVTTVDTCAIQTATASCQDGDG